jgi:hypothetical protein
LGWIRPVVRWKQPGSQTSLEGRGGFESYVFRGGDFHRFAGLRVAADAGSALFHFKGAKSDNLDLLVLLDALYNGIENGGYCFFGGALGGFLTEGFLDCVNKFSLVHGGILFASVFASMQAKSGIKIP